MESIKGDPYEAEELQKLVLFGEVDPQDYGKYMNKFTEDICLLLREADDVFEDLQETFSEMVYFDEPQQYIVSDENGTAFWSGEIYVDD